MGKIDERAPHHSIRVGGTEDFQCFRITCRAAVRKNQNAERLMVLSDPGSAERSTIFWEIHISSTITFGINSKDQVLKGFNEGTIPSDM